MDVRTILAISILCLILTGCNDDSKIFGVKIGSAEKQLRNQVTVVKEDLIPSKVHYLELTLEAAPENEVGDDAKYTVSVIDGKVVGIRAIRNDKEGDYYSSMVAYAKNKMGEPVATEKGVLNETAVANIPLGCAKDHSCPTPKYTAFRNGSLNALVSSGSDNSSIMFYDDSIQEAFKGPSK